MSDADLPRPSKAPCGTCPYRRDVPAGIWAASEYEKLPGYDGEPLEQLLAGATALFMCHQNNGHLCSGWVGCHDMAQNIAARFDPVAPETFDYVSPVPLFGSGREAAEHGLSGVEEPDEAAQRAIDKLMRKRARRLAEPPIDKLRRIMLRWRRRAEANCDRDAWGPWRGIGDIVNAMRLPKETVRGLLIKLVVAGDVEAKECANGVFWRGAMPPP